jgi:allantoinase
MPALLVRGKRMVLPDGMRPASVHVEDSRIVAIGEYGDDAAGGMVIDAGDSVVLPGLVDTHVHINDPGRSDWEGFDHATRAAAAGGVTTLVDMPLNSIPPTTTLAGLDAKRRTAAGRCHVDVGFWGGVVPGNVADLEPLVDHGVLGFKCFLSPSGVDEFEHVDEKDLRRAMPILAALGVPLLVHAELPALLRDPAASQDHATGIVRAYSAWLKSRPPEAEHAAIDLLIGLAREFGTHVHIVHLASAHALPAVAAARTAGVPLSVETCPHYLTFAAEEIGDGATAYKCAPPIRERDQREKLWRGLATAHVDLIGTDHSPAPPAMKRLDEGDFVNAWGGIASLQIGLSIVWTGATARGLSITDLARWMSAGPARLAGLHQFKGSIAVGRDADFVIFDPDAESIVDGAALYHRHSVTPYHGARLRGRVQKTVLRGEIVYDEGQCRGAPSGRLLTRGTQRGRSGRHTR